MRLHTLKHLDPNLVKVEFNEVAEAIKVQNDA